MALEILPFSDEHVDAAGALLAEAHARHLSTEPLLGRVEDFREQVARQWEREGSSGSAAFRNGELVGYLIGATASNNNRGGTRVFTDIAGHATSEPKLARDLFAAAATRWHDEGQDRFAVVVPADDAALLDAWLRVGFGLQFSYGVRDATAEPPFDAGVTIRAGSADDLATSPASTTSCGRTRRARRASPVSMSRASTSSRTTGARRPTTRRTRSGRS